MRLLLSVLNVVILTYNYRAHAADEKNAHLIMERSLSFEKVVFCIQNGGILDKINYPNKEKYPNQNIYVVLVNDMYI